MKSFKPEDFKIDGPFQLAERATDFDLRADEEMIEDELNALSKKISKLQDRMYAHNQYSVLICLQGMDTSGKDSLIREVFKECNVRGVEVHSFKTPSTLELQHDYLWRHYIALPERGKIGIFNRTHYENVLVTRVHPEYILGEHLPGINSLEDITDAFWAKRMEQIMHFEQHLVQNGTVVLKFFLHVSKEEQRQRLLRRLEEADHNWKFSPGDLREREHWQRYQECYEEAIGKTTTAEAPWFVIPADDKDTARYLVASIILDAMKSYKDIDEPELDDKIKANIEMYRQQLKQEG